MRRSAILFIFITVVLDILALGIIIPILPKLVTDFMGGDAAGAAKIYGLFGTIWALMHFFCSPAAGALSDRFGRRPVILLSNLGLGLDYVLMALAPSLTWLFVGRIISGITASSIPAASAYVADTAKPEDRAKGFGLLGAAFSIGFILGPALGGVLGSVNPRLPFWAAAALSLLNALYGLFILPESLPPEKRAPFTWKKANPIGALDMLRSSPALFNLAVIHFLRMLAHVALPSTFVLYAAYRYGWDARAVGLTLAAVGFCGLIVQGGLVRPAVKRFGEHNMLFIGLLFGTLGFAVYGSAPTGLLLYPGIPLLSLWGLAGPALQGLMTRLVGESEQGRLQGANASLVGLAELFGPGLFTLTFAFFIGPSAPWHLPGAPFLLAALLLAVSAGLTWRLMPAAGPVNEKGPGELPDPFI